MFPKFNTTIFLFLLLTFPVFAQEFKQVADGIEYAEIMRGTETEPIRLNLLRLDLTKVRLDVVHALDAAIGLEKTSSIATRHGAIAAINAGFFRLDKSIFAGDDVGILQIDGKLLSESYAGRIALLINNTSYACTSCIPKKQTVVWFEHLKTFADFYYGEEKYLISGINRELKDEENGLFTPEFGKTTPLSKSKILEIIVKKNKVKSFIDSNGETDIPKNSYVISIAGKQREQLLSKMKTGKESMIILQPYVDKIPTPDAMSTVEFRNAEDIVAGVPQLIKDGKIEITWEQEKSSKSFVETKHPRTAVAKLKDGKFLMVTVDGRSESSGGMSLQQLAEFLLEQGAIDAMNLDGGGSTTMFLDGKIVNHPSDKEGERSVGDAILVFPRKKQ